jgi:hypothetical protein
LLREERVRNSTIEKSEKELFGMNKKGYWNVSLARPPRQAYLAAAALLKKLFDKTTPIKYI